MLARTMDDQNLEQLTAALAATPDNQALLGVVLRARFERGEAAEGYALLAGREPEDFDEPSVRMVAARLSLAAGHPERALEFADSNADEALLVRAKALLDLDRTHEARKAYRAAVASNATLEDPDLEARLSATVTTIERGSERPRLRVISNHDTSAFELERLLQPEAEVVTFADVGGLSEVKRAIHKKIILPFQKPSLYKRFRKRIGGGILMYGPPGCGKTLLARATAGECEATFYNIAISDVLDMYIGESERKLHELFERARADPPSVLFFDEVEALGGKRQYTREASSSKLVSQFLSEMDGFSQENHGVLILAASNVPWSIDPAFRRPGRFDRVLFVPPPDRVARGAILELLLADRPIDGGADTRFLAKHTSGFSGADLRELVESAVDDAIEESLREGEERAIRDEHLKAALKEVGPTTLEWLTTARNYARYSNESGQYDEVLAFLETHGRG